MEIELQCLKLRRNQATNIHKLLAFVAERSLPHVKPHLLDCSAKDMYELIRLAQKIEPPPQASSSPTDNNNQISIIHVILHLEVQDREVPGDTTQPHKNNTIPQLLIKNSSPLIRSEAPNIWRVYRPLRHRQVQGHNYQLLKPQMNLEPDPTDEPHASGSFFMCKINLCNSETLRTVSVKFQLPSAIKEERIPGADLIGSGSAYPFLGNEKLWTGNDIKPWRFVPVKLADGSLQAPPGTMDYKFSLGGRVFTTSFALLPTCNFTSFNIKSCPNDCVIVQLLSSIWWIKCCEEWMHFPLPFKMTS